MWSLNGWQCSEADSISTSREAKPSGASPRAPAMTQVPTVGIAPRSLMLVSKTSGSVTRHDAPQFSVMYFISEPLSM